MKPGRHCLFLFSICVTALGLLSACASGPKTFEVRELTAEEESALADAPDSLRPLYRQLFEQGRRNEVLNLLEIGSSALHQGNYPFARRNFDAALGHIQAFYADTESARKARSLWYQEAEKDFKGEPYERAMAFLYRGLLYLHEGDYGNAQAAFQSGVLQDAFAEEEQYSADFASLILLAGWANQLQGNSKRAQQLYREYQQYRPDSPLPQPDHNLLVLVETGSSPRKLSDGVGHYELVYRRGKNFADYSARVLFGGNSSAVYPIEDLYFQAATRGGRQVDRIIQGKVAFKQNVETTGSALTALARNNGAAAMLAASGGSLATGFYALTAIGVAAQGLSTQAQTQADTRYWHRLPNALHFVSQRVQEGQEIRVEFLDRNGAAIARLNKTIPVQLNRKGHALVLASSIES